MAFTKEAREKALAVRRANKLKREAAKAKKAEVEVKIGEAGGGDVPRETMSLEPPIPQFIPDPEPSALDPNAAYPEVPMVDPDPNKPETIPANYLSGFVRRLEVFGDKPGFIRRWFNDDKGGSNVGAALQSGWRFAERKDVQLNAAVTPRNADLGSRVQQVVGTNENGTPLFAYLMEIPEWLFNKHQEARIAYHNSLRAQIKAGTIGMKTGDGRYSRDNLPPGERTKLPGISMDTKLVNTNR